MSVATGRTTDGDTPSSPAEPEGVGELYDRMTDLMDRTRGGYQHGGLWAGPEPARTAVEAGDRLTDRVGAPLGYARGGTLLDVGSGSGKASLRMAERLDVAVVGITLSPYEARLSQQRAAQNPPPRGARFHVADVRELPYENDSFDAAVAIESICHLDDRVEGFRELARVLRPGSRLALTDFVLRRPYADPRTAGRVDEQMEIWHQGPVLSASDYASQLRAGGLDLVDLDDLGEAVRPAWNQVADDMLAGWPELKNLQGASYATFEDMAAQLRWFGSVTEIGYGLYVARVPG